MKKAIVALMLVICAATLFAASWSQTIVLVSVVEARRPDFNLDVASIQNGYAEHSTGSEVAIHALDIREDTTVALNVMQSFSNFAGQVVIGVKVSELVWDRYSTKGMQISSSVIDAVGRTGYTEVSGQNVQIVLDYNGRAVTDSVAAEISVRYNGNQNLPAGDYVSYITMSYEVN